MASPSRRAVGQARREHVALGEDLARLVDLARSTPRAPAARQYLCQALDAFLSAWGARLLAHVAAEEHLGGTLEAFRHERESFADVLDLLRQGREWLVQLEPGAEAEVAAALSDLHSLWAAHVRRAEVLAPLFTNVKDPGDA